MRIMMGSSSESISYWVLAAPVQERSSCCDVRTSRANYTEATAAGVAKRAADERRLGRVLRTGPAVVRCC